MSTSRRLWLASLGCVAVLAGACAKGSAGDPGPGTGANGTTTSTTTTATGGAGGSTTSASGGAGGVGASGASGGDGGSAASGAGASGGSGGAGGALGGAGGAGASGANGGAGGAGASGGAGGSGGNELPGPLAYEKVLNNSILDDLRRVRWHPSGAFALVLGTAGKVARYDAAGGTLALLTTLGKRVEDLDVAADGSYFLLVGTGADDVGRLWRASVDGSLQITTAQESTLTLGQPRAIERQGNGDWAIGAYGTDSISYVYVWHDGAGITATKGFNASAGLQDLMWGDPAILASNIVMTTHGVNGADSRTWVRSSDLVVSNNWPASFGNAGGAGWRPGGSYGVVTGWSSNKLYVYGGAWTSHTLPGVGTAASPQAVCWNTSGTRALVVGRAIGPGLSATVIDLRPSGPTFSASDLVNQSIPTFDQSPWFGNSSSYLLAADFRPASACTEGLIAGSDNGTSLNPTFGLLVRFRDLGDPDCP